MWGATTSSVATSSRAFLAVECGQLLHDEAVQKGKFTLLSAKPAVSSVCPHRELRNNNPLGTLKSLCLHSRVLLPSFGMFANQASASILVKFRGTFQGEMLSPQFYARSLTPCCVCHAHCVHRVVESRFGMVLQLGLYAGLLDVPQRVML